FRRLLTTCIETITIRPTHRDRLRDRPIEAGATCGMFPPRYQLLRRCLAHLPVFHGAMPAGEGFMTLQSQTSHAEDHHAAFAGMPGLSPAPPESFVQRGT